MEIFVFVFTDEAEPRKEPEKNMPPFHSDR